jgi:TonB family protein
LKALAYVQCKGLAHGRLQPSNIMAVSDQLKISSDTIRPNGEWSKALDVQRPCDPPELVKDGASAAGDVWSLGVTLVEVMTKRLPSWETSAAAASLPDGLPKTFRASVLNCLRRDPQQRWTVASFAKSLDPDVDLPKPQPTFTITAERRTTKRRYPLLAGAIALTIAGAAMVPRLINDRPKPQPDVVPRQLPAEVVPPKSVAPEPSKQAGVPEIVKQVLPDVPAKARSTIRGRVTVDVVVAVDGTGSVANAKSVSKQTSRYFTDLALRAARDWKFAPANTGRSRTWTLRFRFLPDAQRPVTVQATPVP